MTIENINNNEPTKTFKTALNSAVVIGLLSLTGLSHAEDMSAENVPVPSARITNTQSLIPVQYTDDTLPPMQTQTSTMQTQALPVQTQTVATQTQVTPVNTTSNAVATPTSVANDPMFNAPDISNTRIGNISVPSVRITDVSYIQTNIISTTRSAGSQQIDVSLLDDFIADISPKARHYPTNFKNASDRYYSKEKLKTLEEWLRPYAEAPNASYDVLMRAAKLNGMARNLDLGSDYAVRASNYVAKALTIQPDSTEANFLYGMMLSEGGGFKEGAKYLNKAASLGYKEAEQSLAQADLLNDNRAEALSRLQRLQSQNPNDADIPRQIQIIQNGDYYIWDLPE